MVNASKVELLRKILLFASLILITKAIGAVKESVVAYKFGTTKELDIYLYGLSLVMWPIALWHNVIQAALPSVGGGNTSKEKNDLLRELVGVAIACGTVCSLILLLSLFFIINIQFGAVNGNCLFSVLPLAFVAFFGSLIGVANSLLITRGNGVGTLLESIPAILIALACLYVKEPGVSTLVTSTLAGFALQSTLLTLLPLSSINLPRPRFTVKSPLWAGLRNTCSAILFGQLILSLVPVLDTALAATTETGTISTLGYASRLLSLFLGLGATVISRASLSFFIKYHSEPESKRVVRTTAVQVIVISILLLPVAWLVCEDLVRLVFQHGSFDEEDAERVTALTKVGLIQMPFYFGTVVFTTEGAARGRSRDFLQACVLGIVAKIISSVVLLPIIKASALWYGTAVMYAVMLLTLWWRRKM